MCFCTKIVNGASHIYIEQVGSNPLEVKNLRRLFQKFNALRQLKGDTKDN